jgi:hypothetical protein
MIIGAGLDSIENPLKKGEHNYIGIVLSYEK